MTSSSSLTLVSGSHSGSGSGSARSDSSTDASFRPPVDDLRGRRSGRGERRRKKHKPKKRREVVPHFVDGYSPEVGIAKSPKLSELNKACRQALAPYLAVSPETIEKSDYPVAEAIAAVFPTRSWRVHRADAANVRLLIFDDSNSMSKHDGCVVRLRKGKRPEFKKVSRQREQRDGLLLHAMVVLALGGALLVSSLHGETMILNEWNDLEPFQALLDDDLESGTPVKDAIDALAPMWNKYRQRGEGHVLLSLDGAATGTSKQMLKTKKKRDEAIRRARRKQDSDGVKAAHRAYSEAVRKEVFACIRKQLKGSETVLSLVGDSKNSRKFWDGADGKKNKKLGLVFDTKDDPNREAAQVHRHHNDLRAEYTPVIEVMRTLGLRIIGDDDVDTFGDGCDERHLEGKSQQFAIDEMLGSRDRAPWPALRLWGRKPALVDPLTERGRGAHEDYIDEAGSSNSYSGYRAPPSMRAKDLPNGSDAASDSSSSGSTSS